MKKSTPGASVGFDQSSFIIDGQRRVLLIGTINYFRMHSCDWEHRLRLFKESGFNTVDVYVAWGFHEMAEGKLDFESPERDLDRYLRLCGELGLWVYLRPGPYICNEFDGGGLPAWLYHKQGVEVRQNEPNYLAEVKRYLAAVNRIAAPHQRTRGGPIILYAIENELDFFPTRDVAGYMTALRDCVRADGIDVPLTACIGQRTPIAKAMGFIDEVIPTPNIYVGGEKVEAEASLALRTLREARSLTGQSYNVPPFVTEMGRDENSLRRILSCGFKGLGPFNFAGGSNWERFHAVNNWGDYKQLTTSIDFGGMIRFDGTIDQTYFDARRLSRFISCVDPELSMCEPVESVVAVEGGTIKAHCMSNDDSLFVFLPNLSASPQQVSLDTPRGRVPREGSLTVPAHKTPIVTAGLSLERFGVAAKIDYCTAEFWALRVVPNGMQIELALHGDEPGEIAFEGLAPVVVHKGETIDVAVSGSTIRLVGVDAHEVERTGIESQRKLGEVAELADRPWRMALPELRQVSHEWQGALRSLEQLGVFYGAGEYETTIDLASPAGRFSVDYAADYVALWIDDQFQGTHLADGNPCRFEVALDPGRHHVRLRASCWGRPCFHDEKWPAARLGSPRGLVGNLRLDDQAIDARWRFTADPIQMPVVVADSDMQPLNEMEIAGGTSVVSRLRLDRAYPHGAVLQVQASQVEITVFAGGSGVARMAFDDIFRFTGGPADRVLIPGTLLARPGSELVLAIRGTQILPGRINRVALQEIVEA